MLALFCLSCISGFSGVALFAGISCVRLRFLAEQWSRRLTSAKKILAVFHRRPFGLLDPSLQQRRSLVLFPHRLRPPLSHFFASEVGTNCRHAHRVLTRCLPGHGLLPSRPPFPRARSLLRLSR